MNWKQKTVFTIGFVLILATGLFPPWVQSWDFVAGGEDVWFRIGPGAEGYSWIFRPPGAPSWVNSSFRTPDDKKITDFEGIGDTEISAGGIKMLLKSVRMPGSWRARIDITRLLIEWLMVATGVFLGVTAFAPESSKGRSERKLSDYVGQ
jgi:hypothetical protein